MFPLGRWRTRYSASSRSGKDLKVLSVGGSPSRRITSSSAIWPSSSRWRGGAGTNGWARGGEAGAGGRVGTGDTPADGNKCAASSDNGHAYGAHLDSGRGGEGRRNSTSAPLGPLEGEPSRRTVSASMT